MPPPSTDAARVSFPPQPPFEQSTVQSGLDRVAAVRPELLGLADALEDSPEVDPASVALLHELLANGCSPPYNPNLAAAELQATITRVHAGLAPAPPHDGHRDQNVEPPGDHARV